MANQKVSDMTTRAPQSTDLLMLAVEDIANYKAEVPTFGKVFCPEWYGAVGDGVTDDTEAVQDAIDAASVQGGTVKLAQTYAIAYTATQLMANYNVAYGVWVNADNVCIEGPGTIVPYTDVTTYTLIAFGNGGAVGSHPGELGTWTHNVGCWGLNVNTTGKANTVHGVGFFYCKGFYVINCHFADMTGHGIFGLATQRQGRIIGNIMDAVATNATNYCGLYLDGASYTTVLGNYIGNSGALGIRFLANLDNGAAGVSKYNRIEGNTINASASTGMQLSGWQYGQLHGNYIYSNAPAYAVVIESQSSAAYEAEGSWNSIVGNYIFRASTAATAIQFAGMNVSAYDGLPLLCRLNFCAANFIDDQFSGKFSLGQQSEQNIITPDNIWDTVGTFTADDTTPSVSAGFNVYKTANANPTTVTMLDNGYVGQRVTVLVQDANTTIDFTGTNLKGNAGGDWNPANGDLMTCTFDGTNWYCDVIDAT